MLTYENFKKFIQNNITYQYKLNNTDRTAQIVIQNGRECLLINSNTFHTAMLVPMDELYTEYQDANKTDGQLGNKADDILRTVIMMTDQFFGDISNSKLKRDTDNDYPLRKNIINVDDILNNIICILVKKDEFKDFEIPCEEFDDLMVAYCICRKMGNGFDCSLITTEICEKMGLATQELYYRSRANMYNMFPPQIISLQDALDAFLKKMGLDELITKNADNAPNVYELISPKGVYGSVYITFPEVLTDTFIKMGGEYFVYPQTDDICFLVRADLMKADKFKEIIDTYFVMNKKLSEHVYQYNKATNKLTRVL